MSGPRVRHGTQLNNYNKHLTNLKCALTKIDNEAPRLPISVYLNEAKLYEDIARLKQVEIENRNDLKKINIIYRTKGKVNCQFEKYSRSKTLYIREKADLEIKRKRIEHFLDKLAYVNSSYNKKDLSKEWEKTLKIMKITSKYPEFYDRNLSRADEGTLCPKNVISDPATHEICFLDLKIPNIPKTVRIEIELYNDIVPQTAANFASLCRGAAGLTYKNSVFHRVVPGLWCVGGDIVNFSGTGGNSIYGPNFPDENFVLQHNGPGVIAMYSSKANTNNSQFFITFNKLITLNGIYVVFGRVKSNLKSLALVESCGTKGGKPLDEVKVEDCGVYDSKKSKKLTSPSKQSSPKSTRTL